jgi:REP element-mobilizing transposase RayT
MTIPRSQQIDLSATSYYHVVSRCVRRAFLCGVDTLTGRNFDHRRGWLVERFRYLTGAFAIDCGGFAIMSNHFHLILRIDGDRAQQWTDDEVIRRWGRVCTTGAASRYAQDQALSEDDRAEIAAKTALWRQRLHDLSWFMKLLNEHIARRANQEDSCKGHFWESRFKSQALLDERAVLAAMAYVDLNPIRANKAHCLVESDFTSVQERIVLEARAQTPSTALAARTLPYDIAALPALLAFADNTSGKDATPSDPTTLPCTLANYIELVEWTGQQLREDKRGVLPIEARSVLVDLRLDPDEWLHTVRKVRRDFAFAIGAIEALQRWRDKFKRRWIKGLGRRPHTARRGKVRDDPSPG